MDDDIGVIFIVFCIIRTPTKFIFCWKNGFMLYVLADVNVYT